MIVRMKGAGGENELVVDSRKTKRVDRLKTGFAGREKHQTCPNFFTYYINNLLLINTELELSKSVLNSKMQSTKDWKVKSRKEYDIEEEKPIRGNTCPLSSYERETKRNKFRSTETVGACE